MPIINESLTRIRGRQDIDNIHEIYNILTDIIVGELDEKYLGCVTGTKVYCRQSGYRFLVSLSLSPRYYNTIDIEVKVRNERFDLEIKKNEVQEIKISVDNFASLCEVIYESMRGGV